MSRPFVLPNEGKRYPKLVGHCKVCGIKMMSKSRFQQLGEGAPGREGWSGHAGRGLCRAHWTRQARYGDPEHEPGRPRAKFTVEKCLNPDCGVEMIHHRYRRDDPELAEKYPAIGARGLCRKCYNRMVKRQGGRVIERVTRPAEDTLEDWEFLRDQGLTLETAAARMDMTVRALEIALQRARDKGDQRGSLVPFGHDMRRHAA